MFYQKIVAWYQSTYLNTSKASENVISSALASAFKDDKPRRQQEINMFTHLHTTEYHSKINDTYTAALTAARVAHEEALKTNPEAKMAKVERMTYQRSIIKAHFDALMPAEQTELQEAIEKKIQADLREWELLKDTNTYAPE